MEVNIKANIEVSAEKLVERMTMTELASFCSALSEKLNSDFNLRTEAAENFADGLSENGCRFLAEVVTSHYIRSKRKED